MRILCGGPVSEDASVFEAHIASLKTQCLPLHYKGIDNSPVPLAKPEGVLSVEWRQEPSLGEYKQQHVRWDKPRFRLLSKLREEMRVAARDGGYDYLFMVDSDLILNPDTLGLLLESGKDFIAGMFWTRFRPDSRRIWVNVWNLDGKKQVPLSKGMAAQLHFGGVHQVDITGACSLLSRRAIENLSYRARTGIWSEDICMVMSAREAGIPLFVHAGTKIETRRRR